MLTSTGLVFFFFSVLLHLSTELWLSWNLGAQQFGSIIFTGAGALSASWVGEMPMTCSSLGAGLTYFSHSEMVTVTVMLSTCFVAFFVLDLFAPPHAPPQGTASLQGSCA